MILSKVNSKIVSRSFNSYSVREDTENGDYGIIEGVPIVFEQPTDIGGMFEETIASGAISEEALRDCAFFYNHDLNTKPLAKVTNERLKLTISSLQVYMETKVNLKRSDAKDLYLAIKDMDINGMSFMFIIEDEEWTDLDTNYPKRRIIKIKKVIEVSAVNYPAYERTSINARDDKSINDKKVLDEARARLLNKDEKRSSELELEKLKAKFLYRI